MHAEYHHPQRATPRAEEECARLKRYIEALKQAHKKEIAGLLAQARQQARQIAELRMEAGKATASAAAATAAGQGSSKAARRTGLKVEDIVPLAPIGSAMQVSTAEAAAPSCSERRAG